MEQRNGTNHDSSRTRIHVRMMNRTRFNKAAAAPPEAEYEKLSRQDMSTAQYAIRNCVLVAVRVGR